jgi:hypothetical protein
VDSELEPIPTEDLIEESGLTAETFGRLIEILIETKTADRESWELRGELSFPGMRARADMYTKTVARRRAAAGQPPVTPAPPAGRPFGSPGTPPINPKRGTTEPTPRSSDDDAPVLSLIRTTDVSAAPCARFEEFWALYPKHTDKKRSEALWCSKTLNVERDTQLFEAIMSGLRRQCDAWTDEQRDLQYTPSPYQYLKHRRWEDEAQAPRDRKMVRGKTTVAMQQATEAFLARHPDREEA